MSPLAILLDAFPGSEVLSTSEREALSSQLDSWHEYQAWKAHNARCDSMSLEEIPSTRQHVYAPRRKQSRQAARKEATRSA